MAIIKKTYWYDDGDLIRRVVVEADEKDFDDEKARHGVLKGKHSSAEPPAKLKERWEIQCHNQECMCCRAAEYPQPSAQLEGIYDTFNMRRMNAGKLKAKLARIDAIDPDLKNLLEDVIEAIGDVAPKGDSCLGKIQAVKRKHKKLEK